MNRFATLSLAAALSAFGVPSPAVSAAGFDNSNGWRSSGRGHCGSKKPINVGERRARNKAAAKSRRVNRLVAQGRKP